MKIVKVERAGRVAEGLLDGDDVHIVGAWRDGPAELAPFALSKRLAEDMSVLPADARRPVGH